jgi:hypothetical protein
MSTIQELSVSLSATGVPYCMRRRNGANFLYVSVFSERLKSWGKSRTHLMPSAHTLALGFIGLNSSLASWKPTWESNARSPMPTLFIRSVRMLVGNFSLLIPLTL